ncbi:MAG: hypothetical protein K2M39_08365 [Muribaculaceae bacterium]|nr:hypothetical protein [Muribaculaceae bacterium]
MDNYLFKLNLRVLLRTVICITALLIFVCTGEIEQLSAQTKKYTTAQRKTTTRKGVASSRKTSSSRSQAGQHSKSTSKASTNKEGIFHINVGSENLNLTPNRRILYKKIPITGSFRETVIRNNKPVTQEFTLNVDWLEPCDRKDGEYFKHINKVREAINNRLIMTGASTLTDVIGDIDMSKDIIEWMKTRVNCLGGSQHVLKNTIDLSFSLYDDYGIIEATEKSVDINGKTTESKNICKVSSDGSVFSPFSEILDSKPVGIKEYISYLGDRKMILGIPELQDGNNAKKPYYQFVGYTWKGDPHTLEMNDEGDVLVLQEYSDTGELIKQFELYSGLWDFNSDKYFDFKNGETLDITFSPREY